MGKRLHVGIALTTDPERSRILLAELCEQLSAAAGIEVVPHGMWHYHHLLEGLGDGELDLVWLPPVLALRATGRGHCVPIALPVRHGVSTYSTALFTRPGSPIRTIADLRGVSAAWVDRQSAAGYLMIRAYLRTQGLDLDEAFSDEKFLGTHDGVAAAVLEDGVDVGATFLYLDPDASTGAPKAAGWGKADVHVICHAGPIPSDVVAANVHMSVETRQLVQRALVGGKHPELTRAAKNLLGADSFVAPVQEHLDSLLAIVKHLEELGPAYSVFPPPRRV
jgi:phosphate/phosphite/phosphonate ABC transporter binding protein